MPYPLVSAIVLCYNQARFVIECLESVKAQQYPHLELIVNDDFSRMVLLMLSKLGCHEVECLIASCGMGPTKAYAEA